MPSQATTTVAYVPVVQSPVVQNAPVYFGSTNTTSQTSPTVVQSPVMEPDTIIDISVNSKEPLGDTLTISANEQTSLTVNVSSRTTGYKKVPVLVETNDPDLPASFIINSPKQIDFFCIAPTYDGFPNNGCKNPNPVSKGTFNFTFSAEGVSKTAKITIE